MQQRQTHSARLQAVQYRIWIGISVRMQVQKTAVAMRKTLICGLPAHDAALRRFQTGMVDQLVAMLHPVLAPKLIAQCSYTELSG